MVVQGLGFECAPVKVGREGKNLAGQDLNPVYIPLLVYVDEACSPVLVP